VVHNDKIEFQSIEEFSKIPILTKDIIRVQKKNLYSDDITNRNSYKNTSGGSTGEPTMFMQDINYNMSNRVNIHLAYSWRGYEPYDDMVTIWGAERDTFEGKKPLKAILTDFYHNRLVLNSFSMSENIMSNYIKLLNQHRPKLIKAYAQSIYELAKFANRKKIKVKKQYAIHSAAGTLYPFMKAEIEEVFNCKVFNYYGSREVGAIASECSAHDGLHILMEHSLVEVINANGDLCKPGEEGEIVVTTLNNFSMPLIRYKIGDVGILKEYESCSCGCNYPKLEKVVGRTTDIIRTKLGSVVMPEYFIHLIGVVCNQGNIKIFQVLQNKLDEIIIKIVQEGIVHPIQLNEIKQKIKLVMGTDCIVNFEFVDHIPKTLTGKFLYTISNIKQS
jgi:phenylacetate-CoA ligase